MSNYDLTRDCIFTKTLQGKTGFVKHISTEKFPWKYIENIKDEKIRYKNDYLFYTGSIQDIKFKKEMHNLESEKICECCGKRINVFPWRKKNSCLCEECDKRLDNDYLDIWKNKKIKNTGNPWWFYV